MTSGRDPWLVEGKPRMRAGSAQANEPSSPEQDTLDAATGLDPEEIAVLDSFIGKHLVRYSQAENRGDFDSGDWRDDEPLLLQFDDGSILYVRANGFHDSGSLRVNRG